MLLGLMQDCQLNVGDILRYAAQAHPTREIVSRNVDEPTWRYSYGEALPRAAKAANMLARLGVEPGTRVSSLAWNTHRHFELFFAVPAMGAVLHTANPRLPDDHLVFTINHAGSTVLLLDRNMLDIVERIRDRLETVAHFIMLADRDRTPAGWDSYEALLDAEADSRAWPAISESTAAFLCYTSGTTGDPKGVLYSHRSVVLHAFAASLQGALGFSAFDTIMPCQSLYHATAWGLPFAGAMNGAKFVLPGDRFDGASLQELIREEGVTFSGGVPTIWTMYLAHLKESGESPGTLRRVIIGGSAVPRAMAEAFDAHGVTVQQIWGMTETSPLGVVSTPTPALAAKGKDAENDVIWTRQGRMLFGVDLKIVSEDGVELPHDGEVSGSLLVRGPWVIERYYKAPASALDAAGWFDTGDVATIDHFGFMRITDRKKDVIKSGGEWISSIDVENVAVACPGVRIAAVVGVFHPKWEERPILLVEPHDGVSLSEVQIMEHLSAELVKWWLPDRIFIGKVPLTATGKIDKRSIREMFGQALTENEPGTIPVGAHHVD